MNVIHKAEIRASLQDLTWPVTCVASASQLDWDNRLKSCLLRETAQPPELSPFARVNVPV